ncbi:PREDICTED: cell wall / vacuolar inhibitor of fructosidase 1-like [Lupinus angustifolius]|uniref:cell wall / vacuolar inhibitor of fructosidase 1-like n=1 Tax=Lupinus angustifolius TaxID=3871 RepID=UPI00092EC774|nr:PREDICTED: cell wall / vacuolar inhibitor of fructosidase 1-like [Lupinus angustifolius]
MSTFNSSILFFFLFALISIPSSHCRTFQINGESLIEKTCKKTPHYNVCIQSLYSTPGSVDVRGLAQIMVHVLNAKVNDALNKIHELQKAGTEPKQGLESCARKYNTMLVADVPKAIQSLKKGGDGMVATKVTNDDAKEATICESETHGPLTTENKAVFEVAGVTAAIATQLYTN